MPMREYHLFLRLTRKRSQISMLAKVKRSLENKYKARLARRSHYKATLKLGFALGALASLPDVALKLRIGAVRRNCGPDAMGAKVSNYRTARFGCQ